MCYERRNATNPSAAMQAASDKRAARMLLAHKARINGEMVDATQSQVDTMLDTIKQMTVQASLSNMKKQLA
ncbi:hypothetical protein [Klebsiella sp. BIGb0407]|uniref:hypothetical protein n=1 Tax=Klebsiella sp. BIGb0407 TaxID=2940603 RepID=UPI002168B2B8|nr:hypothetical protein [Klebsiella sp. BIGb0407]MCS3430514.1 hypothetical protein [Klebsiella sp. BIGb0407]